MAVSAAERRLLLDQITRLAQNDLNALWAAAERLATEDFVGFLLAAYPELASNYHQLAAQVAASWFEESDAASPYIARVAAPLPLERLTSTTEWALGGDGLVGKARLMGSLQRSTFDGARSTTLLNVAETRSRWIRVARPNACAFCRLLASRTGEDGYTSKQAAEAVSGRRGGRTRGNRKLGDKYHDDCYCTPVEIRSNQSVSDVLPAQDAERVQQWNDEYQKARANAGSGDPKQILAAWRQQGVS